jgi:ribosomal protein S18 acetylase RimI-like enzyme
MLSVGYRKATKADAEGKGFVHHTSWIETYTGLFKDDFMSKLSLEASIKAAYDYPDDSYVAIVDGKIVGFCCYCKSRDEDLRDAGEVMSVYILRKFQGFGIGKKLLEICYHELSSYDSIILWVLEDNNSKGFYEHEGFVREGKSKEYRGRTVIRMIKKL